MTTEIVPFEQEIAALQPLGLPDGYRIALTSSKNHWTVDVIIALWVFNSFRGSEQKVSTATVSYSDDSNVPFHRRIEKVRAEAVTLFNEYIQSLQGDDILKSIEDRLNASRDMLVLQSTPAIEEDD